MTSRTDRAIVATRLINAPRELVFQMWTDPAHMDNWWGPEGFHNSTKKIEVKAGGEWVFIMHGPDGTDYPNRIVFDEIVKPEKLVYTHSGESDDEPGVFQTTVWFIAKGDKTELSIELLFKTAAARDEVIAKYGAMEGLNSHLGRLEAYLAKLS